jgi:16S rRNA processing protein RimM
VSATNDFISLGYINGIFGVKGWVKVFSYTRPRAGILDYDLWYLHRQPVKLVQGHPQGQGIVAKLDQIDDRDAARLLNRVKIEIKREQLASLAADDYYWSDLVDLDVFNLSGEHLGRVDYVMETGANDVLVLKGAPACLIPWKIPEIVRHVDLQQGRIDVDWEADF